MGRVVLLNHLDAGAAVLGDLIDVSTFHEAKADTAVPKAVSGSGPAVTVEAEPLLFKDPFEKLSMVLWKNEAC
jgi:hypothetical protein